MTRYIHCECGADFKGESDDELVQKVEDHVKERHPEQEGQWTRERILGMAHEH